MTGELRWLSACAGFPLISATVARAVPVAHLQLEAQGGTLASAVMGERFAVMSIPVSQ